MGGVEDATAWLYRQDKLERLVCKERYRHLIVRQSMKYNEAKALANAIYPTLGALQNLLMIRRQ